MIYGLYKLYKTKSSNYRNVSTVIFGITYLLILLFQLDLFNIINTNQVWKSNDNEYIDQTIESVKIDYSNSKNKDNTEKSIQEQKIILKEFEENAGK